MGSDSPLTASTDRAIQRARLVWSLLQRARLFIIDPLDQYGKYYQATDRYTVTQLAGLDFDNVKEGDNNKLMEMYQFHVPLVPFPSPLPFDAIFLAYGKRLALSYTQMLTRIRRDALEE